MFVSSCLIYSLQIEKKQKADESEVKRKADEAEAKRQSDEVVSLHQVLNIILKKRSDFVVGEEATDGRTECTQSGRRSRCETV